MGALTLAAAAYTGEESPGRTVSALTADSPPMRGDRPDTEAQPSLFAFQPAPPPAGDNGVTGAALPPPQPLYKRAVTTMFWVGEKATRENGYIANRESYWDKRWQANFGGVDDPEDRCGFKPCGFKPRENPFYVALPYGEQDDEGRLKENARAIPLPASSSGHPLKDRWVEVRRDGKVCYGQWEDVGPFQDDDFDYVFGKADKPRNRADAGAGIDVSPAIWQCLGLEANAPVLWRFVAEGEVPPGPWREIVTGRREAR